MAKEIKIEVISIDLGIDVKEEIMKAAKNISQKTKDVADEIVYQQVEKEAQKEATKKEKNAQKTEWDNKLETCHKRLVEQMHEDDPLVSAEELMSIANTTDLTGLMLRIRNYLKRTDSKYQINKKKKNKKTHYGLSE